MKKILSLGLGLILILSCVVLPVSAATPSPEVKDVISSVEAEQSDGSKVEIKLEKADKIDEDLKPESSEEKVVTQTNVTVSSTAKYPLTLKVKIAGVKTTSKMYVLAKDDAGAVKKLEVKIISDGVISLTLDKYYAALAFVADIETATNIGTSDKTGNVTIPAVAMVMVASAAAIVFAKKKVDEN